MQTILFSEENHIGILTLNRPEALNALNQQVLAELDEVLIQVERSKSIRCLILTGSGNKAFVAGADIKEINQLDAGAALRFAERGQTIFTRLEKLPMPVIAAVNGFALGGGLELALACDFIITVPTAKFGLPECTLGIMPGFGGTVRLPRRVSVGIAREMTMTGNFITADEALRVGLVNRVVEADQLLAVCKEVATTIASRAPLAIAAIKNAIRQTPDADHTKANQIEAGLFSQLFNSQDQKEGTKAFVEKRKPQFQGH